MIWHPKKGQRVEIHYPREKIGFKYQGYRGTVLVGSLGPGPINALVQLDAGGGVVVPRGNLVALAPEREGSEG